MEYYRFLNSLICCVVTLSPIIGVVNRFTQNIERTPGSGSEDPDEAAFLWVNSAGHAVRPSDYWEGLLTTLSLVKLGGESL